MYQLLANLKELRSTPINERKDAGICYTVDEQQEYQQLLVTLFKSWEHYSGSFMYPVPDGDKDYSYPPYEAYHLLPRWEGSYGKLRCDLLDHMISELEDILDGE